MRHWSEKKVSLLVKNLQHIVKNFKQPMSHFIIDHFGKDPFLLLVSCLLSLRTRDTVTLPVSMCLFKRVRTPQDILALDDFELQKLIYPVGFYKRKAEQLKQISIMLIANHHAKVPHTKKELMNLPGVGIKTANLVLGMAYNIPAICVDIHVHRISNRLGIVTTRNPEQTEQELKKILPKKYWIEWNRLLVLWGQNVCKKKDSPCALCNLAPVCPKK